MDVHLALAPGLGLSAADFCQAWNDTPPCRAAAEARPAEPDAVQFNPELVSAAVTLLGTVAVGLATNALYDLIKAALLQRGVHKRTDLIQIDPPDGTRLIVIAIVEE